MLDHFEEVMCTAEDILVFETDEQEHNVNI